MAELDSAVGLEGVKLTVPGMPGPSRTVKSPWSFDDDQIQVLFSCARKNWLYGPPTNASLKDTLKTTVTLLPFVLTELAAG